MPPKKIDNVKYYIGIDIGKAGAITVLNSNDTTVLIKVMPTIKDEIDVHEIYKYLKEYRNKNVHVVFEDLHAIFGSSAKATYSFSGAAMAIEMCCVCCDLPFTKVQAKKWQEEMFVGVPKKTKPSKSGKKVVNDTKAMALIAAKRLFPKLSFKATSRSTKDHDGIVDSILIAKYCQKNF